MRAIRIQDIVRLSGRILAIGVVLTGLSCSNLGGLNQGRQDLTEGDLLETANKAYERGDLRAAQEAYRALLAQDPNHVDALFKTGVIDYRRGEFEKSRASFIKVLSMRPDHKKATYNLGVIYAAEGALKNAEKAAFFFERYLSLSPNAPQKEKIARWKALQAAGKRREEEPVTVDVGPTNDASTDVDASTAVEDSGSADPNDLKHWLQQEAQRAAP